MRDKGGWSHSDLPPSDAAPQCGSGNGFAPIPTRRVQVVGLGAICGGRWSENRKEREMPHGGSIHKVAVPGGRPAELEANRMKKKDPVQPKPGETKERIPVWLYPSSLAVIDAAMAKDNCKSRSEYMERAALFYAGFLSGEDAGAFLPPALVAAIRGTLQDSENRTARLLFKLAVELSMTMHVLAAGMEIDDAYLARLRDRCIREVKKTNGSISLSGALGDQEGAK